MQFSLIRHISKAEGSGHWYYFVSMPTFNIFEIIIKIISQNCLLSKNLCLLKTTIKKLHWHKFLDLREKVQWRFDQLYFFVEVLFIYLIITIIFNYLHFNIVLYQHCQISLSYLCKFLLFIFWHWLLFYLNLLGWDCFWTSFTCENASETVAVW